MAGKPKPVVPTTDFASVPLPQPGGGPDIVPGVEPDAEGVRFHETRMIPVEELRPNTWNPNAMSDDEFDRLCREIVDVGFLDPLIVVPVSENDGPPYYRILGGEHRYRAAQVLGMEAVPCIVLSEPRFQDEELQKALTMRLIFLKGSPDPVKLMVLVKEFMQKRSAEATRDAFAFVRKDAWDKMIFQMRGRLKEAGVPAPALKEFDQKTADARTAKDLGVIVKQIMDSYKNTLAVGFMVFSHEGKKHTYIPTSARTQATLDRLMAYLHATNTHADTVFGPMLEQALEGLIEKLAEQHSSSKRKAAD